MLCQLSILETFCNAWDDNIMWLVSIISEGIISDVPDQNDMC